jgi:poly(A) polymerase
METLHPFLRDHPVRSLPAFQDALAVVDRLRAAGEQAFIVGGPVRDLVLGQPPKDFDVTTSAPPERVMQLFPRTVPVGAKFGVVVVLCPSSQVEVATFRTDLPYADGRHPESVVYSREACQDVQRRDFTINGLLYDPLEDALIDHVDGLADLKAGVVRAIGVPRERFAEDHLRLLRAVRFTARLGFVMEPATWAAVCEHHADIASVSRERVRDELTHVLTQGNAHLGFSLLERSGLLAVLLPEVAAMRGVEQPPAFHPEGDVLTHTLLMLESLGPASPTLAWGVLLHDVGKPPTFEIADRIRFNGHDAVGARTADEVLKRLHLSNAERERVVELVAQHLRFMNAMDMRPATLKRFLRQPHFDEHLALHRLDCLASHGDLSIHAFVTQKLAETNETELRPPRLVTGDDLVALGHTPGPAFKAMLTDVEDRQLAGELRTRDDALRFLARAYPAR